MLSDNISDHYLVLCKLHIAKAINETPCYKYRRTISSTTKDCFVSNLPDLSQFLSISNSAEKLDDVTETMDSLFSSTLDKVTHLHLRKIKEKSPKPWYNEHTRALKEHPGKWQLEENPILPGPDHPMGIIRPGAHAHLGPKRRVVINLGVSLR